MIFLGGLSYGKPYQQEFFVNWTFLEGAAANTDGTYRDEAGVNVVGAGSAWFRQQLHSVVIV